jgi:hypothetical protein
LNQSSKKGDKRVTKKEKKMNKARHKNEISKKDLASKPGKKLNSLVPKNKEEALKYPKKIHQN